MCETLEGRINKKENMLSKVFRKNKNQLTLEVSTL